ncbi:enoyl-CoA hydratase [Salinibacterium sp.]|uniref:enoyl-CoA hydratase n=1 Tax=Salinibacterium sp. TaxID=1915057 RepID=UPI00286B4794|nr:enoyl-CoA hydratase [Salinibacterium sp.]
MTDYETIQVATLQRVATITLDRPKALNALNLALMREVVAAVQGFDRDPGISVIVITGSAKAFAAGADIKEMMSNGYADVLESDWFSEWDALARVRKPIIAAVAGYALGGGCELAMMCDFIVAADTAQFGQPEIKLGVIPGIGGSQRLTRAIGKAKAMDLILTGRRIDADEAERTGLVARVVPAGRLGEEVAAIAAEISGKSLPVVILAKEAVNRSFEVALAEGVRFERRVFHSLFALDDQKEGMAAFVEKRDPDFRHR